MLLSRLLWFRLLLILLDYTAHRLFLLDTSVRTFSITTRLTAQSIDRPSSAPAASGSPGQTMTQS